MTSTEEKKRVLIARCGIATAGVVYFLLGILTLTAVFSGRSQDSSKDGVLNFISEQPFGVFLIGLTGAGLLAYSFWKFYQTLVVDVEEETWKNIVKKIGYAGSGLLYLVFGFQAVMQAFGVELSSGGGKESLLEKLGTTGLIIITLISLGIAIGQFYKAFSKRFREKVKETDMDKYARKMMLKAGRIGYTARGVVIAIISYFLYKAAMSANADNVGGTDKAFSFIQQSFGQTLMIIVACGFIAYGTFMFIKARYRDMTHI